MAINWNVFPPVALQRLLPRRILGGVTQSVCAQSALSILRVISSRSWRWRTRFWTARPYRAAKHNALVKESLHNAVRHMISLARAVCCVAFLAKALAIGRKNTPCSPSRSDCHSLATVGQRILKDVDQARRYAQACLSVIAIRRQQLDWVRLRPGVVAFGWWSLLR